MNKLPSDDDYIEVKVYSSGIYPGKAKKIVEQGVKGVISGGKYQITRNRYLMTQECGIEKTLNLQISSPKVLNQRGLNSMDFDFFNEWEQLGTVKVGRHLSGKIVRLKSLEKMDVVQSTFPEGHSDEGCEIERYELGNIKYLFAKEISNILSDECYKLSKNLKKAQKLNFLMKLIIRKS